MLCACARCGRPQRKVGPRGRPRCTVASIAWRLTAAAHRWIRGFSMGKDGRGAVGRPGVYWACTGSSSPRPRQPMGKLACICTCRRPKGATQSSLGRLVRHSTGWGVDWNSCLALPRRTAGFNHSGPASCSRRPVPNPWNAACDMFSFLFTCDMFRSASTRVLYLLTQQSLPIYREPRKMR